MYDNVIMCSMSYRLTDAEVADLVTLFGEHPFLAILEDGTNKDRRRAERRKATARKHQRLEKIASYYPSKDSNKHNLKKRCRESKAWYAYDDLRKDTEADELAEAWEVATYLERRSQFFKAVDQWRHDDALRVLAERMIESLDAQEDPDNRIIVDAWLQDEVIYIRSNCDGWAEDVKPFILLEPGDTVTPADLVGLTETQAKHLYEMDQCGFNIDLIDDEEFIF